jgi:hypothetical protein
MKARRGLLLVGSLWELVRFFVVLLLFAAMLRGEAGAGPWVFPWLLVAGSGNLLIAAGIGMLALFPARYGRLAALLRLGKVLSIFAFILMVISGAMRPAAGLDLAQVGRVGLRASTVLVVVALLDVAMLGVLLRWRPAEEPRPVPAVDPGEKLPEYDETEVNFH